MKSEKPPKPKGPGLFSLLKPYRLMIVGMLTFTIISNGLNLAIPKIVANAIDSITAGQFVLASFLTLFLGGRIYHLCDDVSAKYLADLCL